MSPSSGISIELATDLHLALALLKIPSLIQWLTLDVVAGVVAVAAGEEIVVVVEGIVVVVEEGAEAVTSNPEEAAMAAASVVTEAADVAALEETAAAVVAVLEVIVVAVVAVLGVIVVAVVASEVTGVAVASEVIVEDEAALTAADEVGVDEVVSAVSKTHLKMSLNSSGT